MIISQSVFVSILPSRPWVIKYEMQSGSREGSSDGSNNNNDNDRKPMPSRIWEGKVNMLSRIKQQPLREQVTRREKRKTCMRDVGDLVSCLLVVSCCASSRQKSA